MKQLLSDNESRIADMEGTPISGEESRGDYFELLSCQLHPLFPDFVRNLQLQSPQEREMGRSGVIEYSYGTYSQQRVFKSSTELRAYLQDTAAKKAQGPRQRLFLLEDLSRNYIEVLGSQLRIPSSFFGAHWNDPTAPSFNHRNPFCRFSEDGFVIRYPCTLPIEIDAQSLAHGTVFSWDANVNRHVYCYDAKGPFVDHPKSYHILSYWTAGLAIDGSWDSVLLVDPPIGNHVKTLSEASLIKVTPIPDDRASSQMDSLFPDVRFTPVPSPDSWKWGNDQLRPRYDSIFDDVLSITQFAQPHAENPRASTEISRKLVISIFLAFLRRRYLNTLKLQARFSGDSTQINRCGFLRDFAEGVLSSWHHELYGFIVNVRFAMNVLLKETEDNMSALGLKDSRVIASTTVPGWEVDGWAAIHESCAVVITMADMFLQSYLQFITIQEARLANKNSMSLAKITSLTMLFIPLSTIATIFSMSDEFLPGRGKGWIFWVVSLPVLVLMFMYTEESRLLLKRYWGSSRDVLWKHRKKDKGLP